MNKRGNLARVVSSKPHIHRKRQTLIEDMSSRHAKAGTNNTAAERRAVRGEPRQRSQPEHHPLGLNLADQQAVQLKVSLAIQQLEFCASDAFRKLLKPPAIQIELSGMVSAKNPLAPLIALHLKPPQQNAVDSSATRLMNLFRETEREQRHRLTEIINSYRGLGESIRLQTSELKRRAEASTASISRMAEACAYRLSSLESGQVLNTTWSTEPIGDFDTISDQHRPWLNHAVPKMRSQGVAQLRRCRDCVSGRTPLQAAQEKLNQETVCVDDDNDEKILALLSQFIESAEMPRNKRDRLIALLSICQLHQNGQSSDNSLEFNRIAQAFRRSQLRLPTSTVDWNQQLNSGLLLPLSHYTVLAPDLAPGILTTKLLGEKLSTSTSELKRQARSVSDKGPLPQELLSFPGIFLVGRSNPNGGKNCGWKFQEVRKKEDK